MSKTDPDFADAIRLLAEEQQSRQRAHLSPEELLAYRAGELRDREIDRVQRHLGTCRICAKAVLDIANFPNVAPSDDRYPVTEEEVDAVWKAIQRRFGKKRNILELLLRPMEWPSPIPTFAMSLMLLVSLGSLLWALSLRQTVHYPAPTVNTLVTTLMPLGPQSVNRSDPPIEILERSADAGAITLILHYAAEILPSYRAEIEDAEGKVLWSSSHLRRQPEGYLTISLPGSFLDVGEYRIRIYPPNEELKQPLAIYLFTMQVSEP